MPAASPAPKQPAPAGDTLLRLPEVLRLIPVSAPTWRRGIRAGRYPRGVKVAPRVVAWRFSDIQALLQSL